jgi:prolipoprotein diacylglyceryltransferase
MAFARVGCQLNGCCAGRASDRFGLYLPNHRGEWQRRVPMQLLEGTLALAILALVVDEWRRLPFQGAVFLIVAGLYATGRLVLESLRERPAGEGPFTLQHGISLVIMIAAFGGLAVCWPG